MNTKITKSIFLAGMLIPASALASNSCEKVIDVDFNNHSGSFKNYTIDKLNKDFESEKEKDIIKNNLNKKTKDKVKVEKTADNTEASGEVRGIEKTEKSSKWTAENKVGNGVFRAHYPKKKSGGIVTGFLFDKTFPKTDNAIMEYRFKVPSNFEAKSGGKLPGLGGFANGAGIPVGCTSNKKNELSGFSARMMWRKNDRLAAYMYLPGRSGKCGTDYVLKKDSKNDFKINKGEWHTFRQTLKMNDLGKKNGVLKIEIDGKTMLNEKDVEFRVKKGEKYGGPVSINSIVMHSYRGGSATDKRFFGSRDLYIEFDDFKVWRNCSDIEKTTEEVDADTTPIVNSGPSLPYGDSPITIPGVIEAEHYNRGGEGVAFSDTTNDNKGNNIARENEGVDIDRTPDGGQAIGWVAKNEWVEYSINVEKTSQYIISALASSPFNDTYVQLLLNGNSLFQDKPIEKTGDKNIYIENRLFKGTLRKGDNTLRVKFLQRGVNLDKIYIEEAVNPASNNIQRVVNVKATANGSAMFYTQIK